MKEVYISYCTEYELGWGQRPDGFMVSLTLEPMKNEIDRLNKAGSKSCFWRFTEPTLVFCSEETFDEIKKDIANSFSGESVDKGFVNYTNGKKLKLYKEI